MQLSGERVYIRPLHLDDVEALWELRVRNRSFFAPFEPIRPDSHFTLQGQKELIEAAMKNWEEGTGYSFGIFTDEQEHILGRVNLSNVVRGAWQSCTIGYFLDQNMNGRGIMTEAVRLSVKFAFEHAGLHRVQAAVMPRNVASVRVVEKVGFMYEGLAKFYLKIYGNWEDHHIYSLTKEFWK